jgi:hypothetical protein
MGWKQSAAVAILFVTAVLLISFQLPGLVLDRVAGVNAINPPIVRAAIFATMVIDILIVAPIYVASARMIRRGWAARMIRRGWAGGRDLTLISGGVVVGLYLMWLGTSLWMWCKNLKIEGIDFSSVLFVAYNSLFVTLGFLILVSGLVIHREGEA